MASMHERNGGSEEARLSALGPNDLLRLLDGRQMTVGAARNRVRSHDKVLTPAQRTFLKAIAESPRPSSKTGLQHPEDEANRQRYRRDSTEDLSQVELMWLQRLPHDPAEISFEDAAQLAALAKDIKAMKTPASHRLIQSVWGPVKTLHDERLARAQLEQARRPLPDLPPTSVQAIADSLQAKHPGIGESALREEARNILEPFLSARERDREKAIERAEKRLAEVLEAKARVTELTRDVPA